MQLKLTAIIPRPLNAGAMRAELLLGLKTLGIEIREDFNATVDTWNTKPVFEPHSMDPVVKGDVARVETSTMDKIYGWVSKGTKGPYPIKPVNGPYLIFPGTFSAKTVPGVILANPGFSGPPIEIRGQEGVMHPGIEARKFDETIRKSQERNAKNIMTFAMSKARLASRHAYP